MVALPIILALVPLAVLAWTSVRAPVPASDTTGANGATEFSLRPYERVYEPGDTASPATGGARAAPCSTRTRIWRSPPGRILS